VAISKHGVASLYIPRAELNPFLPNPIEQRSRFHVVTGPLSWFARGSIRVDLPASSCRSVRAINAKIGVHAGKT